MARQHTPRPTSSTAKAREFRKTARWAEDLLWKHLRNRKLDGHKFRRQQPFDQYVLDFFCPEKRLVVELDGREHGEPPKMEHDRHRDEHLRKRGVRVIRFWNFQLRENLEGVLERIRMELDARAAAMPLTPPDQGSGRPSPAEGGG